MKSKTKTVISLNNISKVYEGPPPADQKQTAGNSNGNGQGPQIGRAHV